MLPSTLRNHNRPRATDGWQAEVPSDAALDMKVIIQIPCFNEEKTLPETLADLPTSIDGVDDVEILIIDDGSEDQTAQVARDHGVHYIVSHTGNRGLASAFRSGIDACLQLGADVIVNTDADNQYAGSDIPRLVQPILEGRADIVIGDRQTDSVPHFSFVKKKLQKIGSWVVRYFSHVDVPDAVSGFRALSRGAARQINILSSFSYTIEMLLQAGKKRMTVRSVPITVNAMTRRSRLYSKAYEFIQRSAAILLRIYAMYHPLKILLILGSALMAVGAYPILRFLYFAFQNDGAGHIQSLVLGGLLVSMGFVAFLVGMVADLIAFNRQLMEMTLEKVRRLEEAMGSTNHPIEERDPSP